MLWIAWIGDLNRLARVGWVGDLKVSVVKTPNVNELREIHKKTEMSPMELLLLFGPCFVLPLLFSGAPRKP